ncbi:MAG: hypothetical protein WEG40_14570 [Candidatus Rokuibacteriota bacterium]
MKSRRRCALSRWRKRRRYQHRLAIAELALAWPFEIVPSMAIDRRRAALEAAA